MNLRREVRPAGDRLDQHPRRAGNVARCAAHPQTAADDLEVVGVRLRRLRQPQVRFVRATIGGQQIGQREQQRRVERAGHVHPPQLVDRLPVAPGRSVHVAQELERVGAGAEARDEVGGERPRVVVTA